ncbi:MAG TPA: MFS transporter [Pseudonocardiaceae bacterium]|nr:MFS transporter [Pseudonocardiaceae bacterium]
MTAPGSVTVSMRAGRREWIGLAVLALPTMLAAMDFGVLYLALPRLGSALHASSTQLLWVQDIYGFMIAGFLVTSGNLGDRIGRRKLLLWGAAAFGVLSIVSAYSTSIIVLIVARGLLGIAGATLMPSILALLSNMFRDNKQRSTAISIWATALLVGVAIGPLIGGALLEVFWYGSVFLIGVPVMVLVLILVPRLVPEYKAEDSGRIDLGSVLLSLLAIIPIVYAIKEFAQDGLAPTPVLALVIGLIAGGAFISRQKRLKTPLLDLRLFANREFASALGVLMFGAVAIGGLGFLFSQYLQLVHNLSPLVSGLLMFPDTAGLIGGSLLAPVVARKIRPAYVIGIGMTISAIGFLVLTQVSTHSPLVIVIIGVVIATFGVAPSWVLGTDLIVGSVKPDKAGAAAALSETSSELGISLGVAVLGSIGVAVYRGHIAGHIPAGVPAGAARASGDTLVGATTAAASLPARIGAPLLDAARAAFSSGFALAAAISVPVLLIMAGLAIFLMRNIKSGGEAAEETTTSVAVEPVSAPMPAVRSGGGRYHVRPGSGRGLVARTGDLVLLCDIVRGQGQRVGALYDALADTAESGDSIGLSRRVTDLVVAAGQDGFPSMCAFGPLGEGVVAVVHGEAELTITTGGQEVHLDGRDSVTIADRVIRTPVESVRAVLGTGADLQFEQQAKAAAPEQSTVVEPAQRPVPVGPPVDTMASQVIEAVAADRGDPLQTTMPGVPMPEVVEPPAEPANVVDVADQPLPEGTEDESLVVGVYCRREHFNDPKMAYCTVCGISMAQANREPGLGRRPSLGVLVLDDGTTYSLVTDHVFGRMPDDDAAVIAGAARAVRLPDNSVSRVHARIMLDGWNVHVIDAGSTNGSFLCGPGESSWRRIPSGDGVLLVPGAAVAFGQRQLRYHSHRAQSVDFSGLSPLHTQDN